MRFFNEDNTQGYNKEELHRLNNLLSFKLHKNGIDPDKADKETLKRLGEQAWLEFEGSK